MITNSPYMAKRWRQMLPPAFGSPLRLEDVLPKITVFGFYLRLSAHPSLVADDRWWSWPSITPATSTFREKQVSSIHCDGATLVLATIANIMCELSIVVFWMDPGSLRL